MDRVEKDRALTVITAMKWADDDPRGRVTSQRPAYIYPQVAKFQNSSSYEGSRADVNSPQNLACKNL